jgi:Chemotaxis phosphatase CheX
MERNSMTTHTLEPELVESLRQSAQEPFVAHTDEPVERTITAKMPMVDPSAFGTFQEAADGFGELVNMLAGNFKNEWVASGNQMERSVPTVIHNGSVQVRSEGFDGLRSRARVTLDQGATDFGMYFATNN